MNGRFCVSVINIQLLAPPSRAVNVDGKGVGGVGRGQGVQLLTEKLT